MSSDLHTLIPGRPVPELAVPLDGGGAFDIARDRSDFMSLIVFYRGVHCPQCRRQLVDLEAKLPEFDRRGVSTVAISADTPERAAEARASWEVERLQLGHSLPLEIARRWGLFISESRGKTSTGHEEPRRFSEPGVFLVAPDNTLYASSVQSYPFARPRFEDLLSALDFIAQSNYPPRGNVERL